MSCETCTHAKVCGDKQKYAAYNEQYKPNAAFDKDNFEVKVICKNYIKGK